MRELKIKTEWVDTDRPEEEKPGCPWCGRNDETEAKEILKRLVVDSLYYRDVTRVKLTLSWESTSPTMGEIRKVIGDV